MNRTRRVQDRLKATTGSPNRLHRRVKVIASCPPITGAECFKPPTETTANSVRNSLRVAGKMAALAENPGSFLNTHMATHNCLQLQ